MLIKFKCSHCGDEFSKDELEIVEQNQTFTYCAFCGTPLSIINLKDIVDEEIEEKARHNINRYFKELGIEATIEMIERHKEFNYSTPYMNELRKRGLLNRESKNN